MKKKSMLFLIVSILFTSICIQTSNAQEFWRTDGNFIINNSLLGTRNQFPIKFITRDAQRMILDVEGRLGINTTNPVNLLTVQLNGTNPAPSWLGGGSPPVFMGFAEERSTGFNLATAGNAASYRPVLNTRRSRGTLSLPAVVNNNDYLASIVSSGYDGSDFQNPAAIDFYVDGVPTPGKVPARISLVTGSNVGDRLERLKVGSTGNFNFNNTQLTILESTGNIGIGTATPIAKLHLSVSTADAYQGLAITNINPGGRTLTINQGTPGTLNFTAPGVVDLMTMNFITHNVGIGVTSPAYKLDVAGRMRIRSGGGSAGTWFMNAANTADAAFVGMQSDNYVGLWGNTGLGWGMLMNTTNGNVGIGTFSPAYKLDVAGRMRIRNGGGTAGTWLMNAANTSDVGFVGLQNDNTVGFFGSPGVGWGLVMNSSSGNVGIGTLVPGYKLDVCGTIRAKELRVETGWCDYVFDKGYKLRSLSEVENFINTYKHLPDVTPGSEIENSGLEVGKVSSQMIKKIEELTLYIIEQGKAINMLKEQNSRLETKVNLLDKKGGK